MQPLSPLTAKLFEPIKHESGTYCELSLTDNMRKFTADFWLEYPNDRVTRYTPGSQCNKFVNRFPERKRIKESGTSPFCWELGATDCTVELFLALWPLEYLYFDNEDTRTVFESIYSRSMFADYCAEIVAKFKATGEIPPHNYELADAPFRLSPYQEIALHNAMQMPGYALFMEPGTGKTPVSIAVACNMVAALQRKMREQLRHNRALRTLVVCPNAVRANWEHEFHNFSTRSGLITVLRGSELNRVKQVYDANCLLPSDEFTTVICGYETLSRSWDALGMIPWDLAILDEAHAIKNVKTKRFQTAIKLRDVAEKRLLLTGTAIANSAMDLYGQLEFLGEGYSGFSSYEAYRSFYGVFDTNDQGYQSLVGVQNLPFIQERLSRYSYITRLRDVLPDLPEKMYDIYEVEMTEQQREFYDQLAASLAVQVEAELSNDNLPRSMVINNVLTMLLRLAQITSGHIKWDAEWISEDITMPGRIEYFTPNPKIEAILELLEGKRPENKTIIWSCFTADIDFIKHALTQNNIGHVIYNGEVSEANRDIAVHEFNNNPACSVFVGNQAAGGAGLNLLGYPPGKPELSPCNADHVIYMAQNWSRILRNQSEHRNNRRGTRVPTRITDLIVPGSIDEQIMTRVLSKEKHSLEVNDLREIMKAILKIAA